METTGIKKHFVYTIAMYLIWVGMFAIIVASLTAMRIADEEFGADSDVGMTIGIFFSATLGFGVGGLGIVLSVAGLNIGEKKPKSAKDFGIANFVFSVSCLGTIIAMTIMSAQAVANSLAFLQMGLLPEWRAHSEADVGRNDVILICMVIIAAACIIGIASSARIVSTINKTLSSAGTASTSTSSQQPVAVTGSQRKPCPACGAPNEPDSEFCKKCGKAC